MKPRFIYVIGAQCTGKTTLVEAVSAWLQRNSSSGSFTTIQEMARNTLKLHGFTRNDVRAGGERCLQLQKLILHSQMEIERDCRDMTLVISDRSGVDPLVYAHMFCGNDAVTEMASSEDWKQLTSSMRQGSVILCEPVRAWLHDDGVRLVPNDWAEWMTIHQLFYNILEQYEVPYNLLAAAVTNTEERVKFVLAIAGVSYEDIYAR